MAMLWNSAETLVRRRTLPRTASVAAASTTPGIVPEPPKMLTPPSSTIVTTVRVMPWPRSARALAKRALRITPASAATVPDSTNSSSFSRATGTPENLAAATFLPVAYSSRPIHVRWRTTPRTMASTM